MPKKGGASWDWLGVGEMVLVDSVANKIAGFMLIEPSKKYFSCSEIQQRQKGGPFLTPCQLKKHLMPLQQKSWQWQGEVAKNYFPSLSLCFSFLRETETRGQTLGVFFFPPGSWYFIFEAGIPITALENRRKTTTGVVVGGLRYDWTL